MCRINGAHWVSAVWLNANKGNKKVTTSINLYRLGISEICVTLSNSMAHGVIHLADTTQYDTTALFTFPGRILIRSLRYFSASKLIDFLHGDKPIIVKVGRSLQPRQHEIGKYPMSQFWVFLYLVHFPDWRS